MFIKKRKITKASIEELSKRYPQNIISDEEARNIVAGTRYYSPSGYYLGEWNDGSSDIRIIDNTVYNTYTSSGSMAHFEASVLLERHSSSLSSNNSAVKDGIYRDMASSLGYNGTVTSEWIMSNPNAWAVHRVIEGEHHIVINNAASFKTSNWSDLMCVMLHEVYHAQDNTNTGSSSRELAAYKATVESPYFSGASEAFKNEIYRQIAICSSGSGGSGTY